jgi:hypothetical protein
MPSSPHRPFPVDYDLARDAFLMLDLGLDEIGDCAFLDRAAMRTSWDAGRWLARGEAGSSAGASPAWLFHTAFCGSTLLARVLHAPPAVVALKEPWPLMQLSDASLHLGRERIRPALGAAVALLAEPWAEGGRVLVKPTNSVNRLLPDLLALGEGPALLLHSGLEEFILSCCKKLPAAETRIRWMAQHLILDTRLQRELGIPHTHPFHFLESCVITWYAQMEHYARALAADRGDRLRSLDFRRLLAAPAAGVEAAARHLRMDAALDGLEARVALEFGRNAKATDRHYDADRREKEKRLVRERYAPAVQAALDWAQATVAPCATLPSEWKPLLPD